MSNLKIAMIQRAIVTLTFVATLYFSFGPIYSFLDQAICAYAGGSRENEKRLCVISQSPLQFYEWKSGNKIMATLALSLISAIATSKLVRVALLKYKVGNAG